MAINRFSEYWTRPDLEPVWQGLDTKQQKTLFTKWANRKLAGSESYGRLTDVNKDRFLNDQFDKVMAQQPSRKWDQMKAWKKPFAYLNQTFLQGGLGTAVLAGINELIPGMEQYNSQKTTKVEEFLTAMKRGFFQDRGPITGGDFLYRWGWRPKSAKGKFLRETVGFAMWNVTDFSTFLTFGALTKAGRVAKGTGKLALELGEQAAKGQRALVRWAGMDVIKGEKVFKKLTPMLQSLRNNEKFRRAYFAFNKAPLDPLLRRQYFEIRNKLLKRVGIRGKEAQEMTDGIMKVAKETGQTVEDLMADVVEMGTRGKRLKPGDPGALVINKILDFADDKFGQFLKREKALGITEDFKVGVQREITEINKKIIKARAKGDSVSQLLKKKGQLTEAMSFSYFPYTIDPAAASVAGGKGLGKTATRTNAVKNQFAKESKWKRLGLTPRDMNKYIKDMALDGKEKKQFQKWFSENIGYAYMVRGRASERAVASAQYLERAKRLFGKFIRPEEVDDALRSGFARLDDVPGFERFALKEGKEAAGMWVMPKNIAEDLLRFDNIFTPIARNNTILSPIVDAVNKMAEWWKPSLLAWRPGYYVRNVSGNIMNMTIGGGLNPVTGIPTYFKDAIPTVAAMNVKKPSRFIEAGRAASDVMTETGLKASRLGAGKLDEIAVDTAKYRGLTWKKAYDMSVDQALIGSGQYGIDIKKVRAASEFAGFQGKAAFKFKEAASTAFGALEVNSYLEDGAKLTLFVDQLRKGADPFEAAQHAKKYLFDYGDIGPVDEKIKHALWFWTWTRKNVPLQLELLATKPGRSVGLLEKGRRTLAGGPTPEFELESREGEPFMPRWLNDKVPTRLGLPDRDNQGRIVGTYFPLENWVPTADLVKLTGFERSKEAFFELINPVYKIAIEVGLVGKSLFTGRKIQEFKGQKKKFVGIRMPSYLAYALRNISVLQEVNKVLPKYTDEEIRELGETPLNEMKTWQRFAAVASGLRVYKYDIEEMAKFYKYKVKRTVRKIRFEAKKADRLGNTKESNRLFDIAESMKEEDLDKLDVDVLQKLYGLSID